MKITKGKLRHIIREEVSKLHEQAQPGREELAVPDVLNENINPVTAVALQRASNAFMSEIRDAEAKVIIEDLMSAVSEAIIELSHPPSKPLGGNRADWININYTNAREAIAAFRSLIDGLRSYQLELQKKADEQDSQSTGDND